MTATTTKKTFKAPIENVYHVITDYKSYPEFVEGVSDVNVIEQTEDGALGEYSLNLIKNFKYRLKLKHIVNQSVIWELDSGDLFKINRGSWKLKKLSDNETEVTYEVEIAVKGFIPGSGRIIKKLTEVNLPSMMDAYEKRAQEI